MKHLDSHLKSYEKVGRSGIMRSLLTVLLVLFSFTASMSQNYDDDGVMLISSKADWEKFCEISKWINEPFEARLTCDITDPVTTSAGLTDHSFYGKFDGGGHTLVVNLQSPNQAPFLTTDGATIKNLKVRGKIVTDSKYAAGIVSIVQGKDVTISNCVSDVDIISSVDGDGTHGGIVGVAYPNASIIMSNCMFTGSISGDYTSDCGGLIGWVNVPVTIKKCLVAGTFNLGNIGSSDTFVRNEDARKQSILNDCYFVKPFGMVDVRTKMATPDQLRSGELAFLLKWGQRLGLDQFPSPISKFKIKAQFYQEQQP